MSTFTLTSISLGNTCRRVYILLLLLLANVAALFGQVNTGGSATTANHQKQIVGYITNWDAWKSSAHGVPGAGAYTHLNIDYSKYTILNFSFFGVAKDGSLHSGDYRNKLIYQPGSVQEPAPILHGGVYDSWDMHLMFGELEYKYDFADARVQAAGFVADGAGWRNTKTTLTGPMPVPLKKEGGAKGILEMAHERNVKVVASIGGWSMCKHFPEMAADATKRARFVADCQRLIGLGFDGIDLDWEYPGPYAGMNFTGSQADFANFTTLVQQIRAAIGPDKLITAAFTADPAKLAGLQWSTLANVMSYFNMMTYDYNGGWSGKAGHNSPLYDYPNQEFANFSWDACYRALVNLGVPANKINMGAAFYGRGVVTQGTAALNAPTQKVQRTVDPDGPISSAADFTNWSAHEGTPYYEYIRQNKSGWTEHWDDNAKVPYLTKGNYFLSYDNEQSIGLKAQYVVDKGLSGVIVWTVYEDLEIGGSATTFGPKLVRYSSVKSPLVNKINEVFALGNTGMPTVSITAPANNAVVAPGSSVVINATANDPNGSIAKVEFLLDGTKVGEDASSPYSFTINSLAAGTHAIQAKATDNSGNTATASVSVIAGTASAPTVSIQSPTSGASYTAGASVTITASATDADGTIARVEFFQGTTKLGEATAQPYSYTWAGAGAGSYSLTAKATDNSGLSTTSSAVSITVTGSSCTAPEWKASDVYTGNAEVSRNGNKYQARWWTQGEDPALKSGPDDVWKLIGPCGGGPTNANPVATLTAPANGAAYTAPASVTLTATATDSDGSISKVEFYNGASLVGTATSSPYTVTWSNVTAGTYALSAKATDNAGGTGTSSTVSITVTGGTGNNGSFKVVGYMPSWQGTPDDIQYDKVTHINYSFIRPTTSGGLTAIDNTGKLSQIVSRAHAAGVKVGIAVGGWSDLNNTDFQVMAASASTRTTFVNNLLSLLNTHQLDGVDLDWEYPVEGQDPANFATLMTQLGNALHAQGKFLTAAVSAQGYYANGVLPAVFTAVDFLNIMVYDGGSGADHSPYSYAVSSLDYWAGRGLPAAKTVLGVPFYARPSWKTFRTLVNEGANPNLDTYNGDYYNGINTIKQKTNLAFDRNLGGIMIWELSQDATGNNSLLTAIDQVVDARNGGNNGNTPPTVSITAPANGTSAAAPATVTIQATASDNVAVTKVEFFQNGSKLGEDTSSPYAYTWSGIAAGTYTLTAVATDNQGASTTSSAVSLTVTGGTSGCGGVPQYVENGGYVAGSIVQNQGSQYECKPYPFSGWCNGASWAYAPGTGTYWTDAWVLKGSCGAAARTAEASAATLTVTEEKGVTLYPNPGKAGESATASFTFESAPGAVQVTLKNVNGTDVHRQHFGDTGKSQVTVTLPPLPRGLYIFHVKTSQRVWTKKYIIE
ncbi:glycosyl hydrolase family 18 protein [Dawidia soli]|uniref:chitinase n=1 Tax=Dawidia soli TaxID=2782352 RepID=A0AAP2DG56_9BACT|nr:glycosyl hydrolase family 18 protein [Dawidia soli]MBT1690180.1 T9SS type A sorting domain-containing protein [Dawidia soli]